MAITRTTFQAENVLERTHLQAAIRDNITVLSDDLMVIAEEFGDFEATHRRIDLLCIDKTARLVVVELKRTDDGGHMELQAVRYAAMVSVMTFDDVVKTYAGHKSKTHKVEPDHDQAREALLEWLDDFEDEPIVPRQVSIILASADFSQEITTTVLWLNEFYGTDIRCVRLTPYRLDSRLLLDVQQVIPLPEAAELTVKLKKREAAVRAAESSRDYTKFIVSTGGTRTAPLPKKHAMLHMVHAVISSGVVCSTVADVVGKSYFRAVEGSFENSAALWDAMVRYHGLNPDQPARWHLDMPVVTETQSWVLYANWGPNTADHLEALADLTDGTVTFEAV